jgi:hypothetical protein
LRHYLLEPVAASDLDLQVVRTLLPDRLNVPDTGLAESVCSLVTLWQSMPVTDQAAKVEF